MFQMDNAECKPLFEEILRATSFEPKLAVWRQLYVWLRIKSVTGWFLYFFFTFTEVNFVTEVETKTAFKFVILFSLNTQVILIGLITFSSPTHEKMLHAWNNY